MFVHSNMGWALDLQARQALSMLVPQNAKPTSACRYLGLRDVEVSARLSSRRQMQEAGQF